VYLLHVVENVSKVKEMTIANRDPVMELEDVLDDNAASVLVEYGNKAKKEGVKYSLISGRDTSPGSIACLAIKKFNIINVVVGRKAKGKKLKSTVKKMFVGSTSQYLLDNAEAIVIVLKKPTMLKSNQSNVPKEKIKEKVPEKEKLQKVGSEPVTETTTFKLYRLDDQKDVQ